MSNKDGSLSHSFLCHYFLNLPTTLTCNI